MLLRHRYLCPEHLLNPSAVFSQVRSIRRQKACDGKRSFAFWTWTCSAMAHAAGLDKLADVARLALSGANGRPASPIDLVLSSFVGIRCGAWYGGESESTCFRWHPRRGCASVYWISRISRHWPKLRFVLPVHYCSEYLSPVTFCYFSFSCLHLSPHRHLHLIRVTPLYRASHVVLDSKYTTMFKHRYSDILLIFVDNNNNRHCLLLLLLCCCCCSSSSSSSSARALTPILSC